MGKVRAAGTQFAFIKATEVGDYLDPKFARELVPAKRVGIPRGAYHMVYCAAPRTSRRCRSSSTCRTIQISFRRCSISNGTADSRSCPKRIPGRSFALDKIKIMLEVMESHTGKADHLTDVAFHREVLKRQLPAMIFLARLGRRRAA